MNAQARTLTEINCYTDLQFLHKRVSKMLAHAGRSHEVDHLNTAVRRVSIVSAFYPNAATKQYRDTYVELAAQEKALKEVVPMETLEDITVAPPKLMLIDPKAGNALNIENARTESQMVLAHLDILRDDLAFQCRVNGRSTLPVLRHMLLDPKQYGLLRQRLIQYLTPNRKWSDVRALELWAQGFCCDKPISPATYFTLSFDSLEITIDFQSGTF